MVRRWIARLGLMMFAAGAMALPSTSWSQSCQCEKIECGPCEYQASVSFYTDKCDGGKTKSCQKPQCEPLRNPPRQCLQTASEAPTTTFEPLNIVRASEDKKPFGVAVVVRGDVQLQRADGVLSVLVGKSLLESDVIVTGAEAQLKVLMADKNVIFVAPNSRVKLRSLVPPDAGGFSQATIDLIYGKIRSQVNNKPKIPGKPHFQIRTPAAVAGVRGTDFVVTHLQGTDMTKVETLHGAVQLSGHGSSVSSMVKKGQYASYVAVGSSNPSGVFRDDDIATFVQSGFLTPVIAMSDQQMDQILANLDYQEEGAVLFAAAKPDDAPLCQQPKGGFNQCSWKCVGNPQGAGSCRTDLEGVQCVRNRCDASGQWKSSERLPAANGRVKCAADEIVVAPCDY